MEKITFVTDDGGKRKNFTWRSRPESSRSTIFWYPIQRTTKANAYILKDISTDTDAEARVCYGEDGH